MKFASVLLAASCWLSAAFAMQPGFDAREVVRQVPSLTRPASGVKQSLDDGEFLIDTSGTKGEEHPALAFGGANFLVAWSDFRGGSQVDIYGARVTPLGVVLDPSGFVISHAASFQQFPAASFDGANFLVAWADSRNGGNDIYCARVTPQGTVLDPSGIAISQAANDQRYPRIAFDGANFLVVWQENASGDWDIYGARVTPQGTVLDPSGIVISQTAFAQNSPALAFDGANFLVAWQSWHDNISMYDLYGARVTPGGSVLDTSGIVISQAADYQYPPALAFDGANFLVVWEDWRNGHYISDLYGARVTPQGTVLDSTGIVISQAEYDQRYPSVAFDGAHFLVLWADGQYNSYYDIHGAWVTPQGSVSDEGPVVRQEYCQKEPVLARGTGSQLFLVYQGWAGMVGGKTYNTSRIWGKMNPSPGVEETGEPIANSQKPMATIVRGVLRLNRRPSSSPSTSSLLNVSGCKVLDLLPGANDVRALAPGVYFVREPSAASGKPSAVSVRKVVVTR